MSMYIENNLGKDETIIIKAKKNPLYLVVPIFWVVVFLIAASILTGMYGAGFSYRRAMVSAYAESAVELTYDKADAEEKLEILEQASAQYKTDITSRSALKKAIIAATLEHLDAMGEVEADAYLTQLTATINGDTTSIILEFVLPIVSSVAWGIFAISVLVFITKLLKFLSLDLALTNKRVTGKVGVFSKNSLDFHLDKIDHVQLKASFFGNLLHYYSLSVVSVGGAGYNNASQKDTFVGIRNAQEFKDMATSAIEAHAEEARKAQAAEIARAMGK